MASAVLHIFLRKNKTNPIRTMVQSLDKSKSQIWWPVARWPKSQLCWAFIDTRRNMRKFSKTVFERILSSGVVLVAMIFGQNANANVTFDANLLSPNASNAPGWYNGTGNPNGGFTVDSENGIELGLRAKIRKSPNVIDSPNNIYTVPTGTDPVNTPRASWNYEFSIDLKPLGLGTLTLADITAALQITDLTTGATNTINPLTYWVDDSGFGSTGKTNGAGGAQWGAQNSENAQFMDFPLNSKEAFDINAQRSYQFVLTVNQGATLLGSDTITVDAVAPEPRLIGLLAMAMVGLFLVAQRRNA
jgi:hypothetical protein